MRRPKSPPGDGSPLIVVLLLACLGLVALIAWQAQAAARSHRQVAEEILRDYAALAADEMIQRSARELSYYGFYPVLLALEEHTTGELPSVAELEADDPRLDRALLLIRTWFRFLPDSGTLETRGEALAPAVSQALKTLLAGEVPATDATDRHRARTLRMASEERRFALTIPDQDSAPRLGFEVETEALADWFQQILDRGPLLPGTLAERGVDNSMLTLEVGVLGAPPQFRAGPLRPQPVDPYAPDLTVEQGFGEAAQGVLDGWVVRVTLAEQAAPRLVIGGLPKSRLPLLAALLLLTCGLLVAAILQLRRARALSRLRSDFVSEVSHELRTPLTQIRMFSETLLLGRVRSGGEQRRSLEIIDQEARRLSHLVENVLQFSRGERGDSSLARETCELAPWVREQVAGFAPLAASREVEITCRLVDGVHARVDDGALRQILLNLLDNAVKYGPKGQQVTVGMEADQALVRLFVEDQGPGVPARQQQRIWRSFQRLGRDRRSAVAGAGIGLAVVRQLAELHGGRAWVEAGADGGARFVVELPCEDPRHGSSEPEPEVRVATEAPA